MVHLVVDICRNHKLCSVTQMLHLSVGAGGGGPSGWAGPPPGSGWPVGRARYENAKRKRCAGTRRDLFAAAWKDMQLDSTETGGRRPPEGAKPVSPQRGARGHRNEDQGDAAKQGVVAGSICGEVRN